MAYPFAVHEPVDDPVEKLRRVDVMKIPWEYGTLSGAFPASEDCDVALGVPYGEELGTVEVDLRAG